MAVAGEPALTSPNFCLVEKADQPLVPNHVTNEISVIGLGSPSDLTE